MVYSSALWLNVNFVPADSDLSDRGILEKILESINHRQVMISSQPLSSNLSYVHSIQIDGPFHSVQDIYREAGSIAEGWLRTVNENGLPFSRWDVFKV